MWGSVTGAVKGLIIIEGGSHDTLPPLPDLTWKLAEESIWKLKCPFSTWKIHVGESSPHGKVLCSPMSGLRFCFTAPYVRVFQLIRGVSAPTLTLRLKIAQKPYIYNMAFGPNNLKA